MSGPGSKGLTHGSGCRARERVRGTVDVRCQVCNEPCTQGFVSAVLGQGGVDGDLSRKPDDDAPWFLFTVSPCCGRRECMKTLWNKAVENFDIGSIEAEETGEGADQQGGQVRREPELSDSEKAFLEQKDDVLVQKAGDWLRDHPESHFRYPGSLDPQSMSSRTLVFSLLHEVFQFPEDRAETISRGLLWGGSEGGLPTLRRKIEGLLRGLRARGEAKEKEMAAEDLEKSEGLVPDCVAWAKGLGLRSLRQADVEVFLSENGKELAYSASVRNLWAKTSLALRTEKPKRDQR